MMLAGVRAVSGKAVVMVVGGGGGGGCPVARSHTVVRKVLLQEGKKKSKRKWHTHEAIPKPGDAATSVVSGGGGGGGEGGKMKRVPKNEPRLRALNKAYLNKISEILSTGDFANDLYGRGLELSEVRIRPDLRGVNVYWMATGEPQQDREMDELLNGHAREIRHQISSLRLLGHSPPITFYRDDRHHKLQEVERLLALADYGGDFEPTDPSHHLRASVITTTTTTTPLPPKLKAAIEDLDKQMDTDEREEEEEEEEKLDPFEDALRIANTWTQQEEGESVTTSATTTTDATADAATVTLPKDLPTMRGDVLGVNTNKIYKMIQQNMSRAKADHRRHLTPPDEEAGRDSDHHLSSPSSDQPSSSPSDPLYTTSRSKDIQQWASRYKQMQQKKRSKNREVEMLSALPGWRGCEVEEEEEVGEVHWVEEEVEEEGEVFK